MPERVPGDLRWATRSNRFAALSARDANSAQILRIMVEPLRTLHASDGYGSQDIVPGWMPLGVNSRGGNPDSRRRFGGLAGSNPSGDTLSVLKKRFDSQWPRTFAATGTPRPVSVQCATGPSHRQAFAAYAALHKPMGAANYDGVIVGWSCRMSSRHLAMYTTLESLAKRMIVQ